MNAVTETSVPIAEKRPGLKDAWTPVFKVGAAVSKKVLDDSRTSDLVRTHFSSITAENAMKMESLQPDEGLWQWDEADFIANFARKEHIGLRGHTIIWHQQVPSWIFEDTGRTASKSKLAERLERHIHEVIPRYSDITHAWDVVNEVIDIEKGTEEGYRKSRWFEIGGTELYDFAFKAAHKAAPNARLYYNDYNIEAGKKLEATLNMLKGMLDRGIPIHGVGIQGHWNFNNPDEEILRKALDAYTQLGLDIELTEVDVSIYAQDETEALYDQPPSNRLEAQHEQFKRIFHIASDYPSVKGITTWGVADNHTWLDNFPVRHRKNWPLLFDSNQNEKQIVPYLIDGGLALMD